MICPVCRVGDHDSCPGHGWCDCQHQITILDNGGTPAEEPAPEEAEATK